MHVCLGVCETEKCEGVSRVPNSIKNTYSAKQPVKQYKQNKKKLQKQAITFKDSSIHLSHLMAQ